MRAPRRGLHVASVPALVLLSACDGMQSALDPGGPEAASIAHIGWVMFIGAGFILALVMVLALLAFRRRRAAANATVIRWLVVGGGLLFPVVTLSLLLAYGVIQMGDLRAAPATPAARIEVIGNQWWWEVHYLDQNGQRILSTANEIHIPAGVPVSLSLASRDVIHSFWVPGLAGKLDLVPGRRNQMHLQAAAPGLFRGQCAEYCGAQHARMAFYVRALPPDEYQAWQQAQRRPAAPPASDLALRGQAAFLSRCAQCHTVQGLAVAGQAGPDLTHLASRSHLAGGTLENNRDNLVRWITHGQQVKPGNRMPEFAHLEEQELQALVAYLEGLH